MRAIGYVSVLLLLPSVIGCGKQTSITGTVTYNGAPVEKGFVAFAPEDRSRKFAAPIADGKYSIPEGKPGPAIAVVTGQRKVDFTSPDVSEEPLDYIAGDAKGNSRQITIEAGAQTIDFEITGKPMPK